MNKLPENLLANTCLSSDEKQFLYKRLFFSQITSIAAWGIITSTIAAWFLLYWLKPSLVSSSHILQLLKDKVITHIQLAELAVTGASAVTAVFVLLVFIAIMMISFAKKEKQYFEIIKVIQDNKDKE